MMKVQQEKELLKLPSDEAGFRVTATHQSGARRGELSTLHGTMRTPAFFPIATRGAVKALSAEELWQIQTDIDARSTPILLANTYHLLLKPGAETIAAASGLHRFMGWKGILLTDSGGFQAFSLRSMARSTEDGVEFRSHIDGSMHVLTPETSLEMQSILASDIWMVLDSFPGYPATREAIHDSVKRSTRWAKRANAWEAEHANLPRHHLFGIVQGSTDEQLRQQSAEELVDIGFDGYAIGGLAVGEPEEEMVKAIEVVVPLLPADRPHSLMGVGTPEQILAAVRRGIDLFDCVIPTRNARHGTLFVHDRESPTIVRDGLSAVSYTKVNIRAERWKVDQSPIDPFCSCSTCRSGYSKSYLRYLFSIGETLGAHFATIHNLTFFAKLMQEIREQINQSDTR